jgi:hypothetical protein
MIVPLTLADFLERAEQVYGDRVAWSTTVAPPAAASAASPTPSSAAWPKPRTALDALGVGRDRVAIIAECRPLPREPLRRERVRAHPRAHQLPLNADEIRYVLEHSGSTVALIESEMEEIVARIPLNSIFVSAGTTDAALFGRRDANAALHDHRRERHRVRQLHPAHHRAPPRACS